MRFRKILMTYLTVYLLIFVLFACVMLPLGENMQRLARARIEEENRTRIANGENYLENQMNKYVQTASQLSVNTDFLSLARAKENEAAADKAVYMLRVKKQLHYLLGLLDHVDGCHVARHEDFPEVRCTCIYLYQRDREPCAHKRLERHEDCQDGGIQGT